MRWVVYKFSVPIDNVFALELPMYTDMSSPNMRAGYKITALGQERAKMYDEDGRLREIR